MLPACLDAWLGNHGITKASTTPIAVATTPNSTICKMGRLRNGLLSGSAILHDHCPASYDFCETDAPRAKSSIIEIEANVANFTGGVMRVREGMSDVIVTVGPGHSLRDAAEAMCRRNVGAAVVVDPDGAGPGVITERDILRSVASGEDPDEQRVADHLTVEVKLAAPDWSLEKAAATMVRGGFRHLLVVDGGE